MPFPLSGVASVRLELRRDLPHPPHALGVVEGEHLGEGPVRVPAEEGCLPVNPVQGVAGYPPSRGTSTSCGSWQCGHTTASTCGVSPLIRL